MSLAARAPQAALPTHVHRPAADPPSQDGSNKQLSLFFFSETEAQAMLKTVRQRVGAMQR